MKRVTVNLHPNQHDTIKALAQEWESSLSGVIRRALRHWLEDGTPDPVRDFRREDWRCDDHYFSEDILIAKFRNNDGPRAWRISSPGGHDCWVLPDDRTTGKKRSSVIRSGLAESVGLNPDDRLSIIIGRLVQAGATNIHMEEQ